ncbi:MAG: ATP synthase subunit I [Burkholderiaceae bacterium]|nr:ATP synthase subunit I [Burkholderiaceae bacterium]
MTNSVSPTTEVEDEDSDFKPLTEQEAQEWRKRHPALSVWRVVMAQAVVGALVTLVVWLVSGKSHIAVSAGYGSLAVVLPSVLFARGMGRIKNAASSANAVLTGFFGWEMAKIALTVAMLAAAPKLIDALSWLALLAGMVVTMKTYWIALWARPGVRKTD